MNNVEVSDLLSVDRVFLSRKCTRDDGVLLWMLRQSLFYNHRLSVTDQNKVIDLMKSMVTPSFRMSKGVIAMVLNGKLKLFDDAIHNHCMSFYTSSPQYFRGIVYE